jgi:sec-independent protein translocase protein TatA
MIHPMFGMPAGAEWLVILAIVVLVFGAAKLPELARGTGQALRIFKTETKGLRDDEDDKGDTPAPPSSTALPPATPAAPAAPAAGPVEPGQPGPVDPGTLHAQGADLPAEPRRDEHHG